MEIISIRNGAIYVFVFAFVIAFIYIFIFVFVFVYFFTRWAVSSLALLSPSDS